MKTIISKNKRFKRILQEGYTIVSCTSGRLRIKKQQWFEGKYIYLDFVMKVFNIPSVVSVRANQLTKSILIEYDYNGIENEITLTPSKEDVDEVCGAPILSLRLFTDKNVKVYDKTLVRYGEIITDWETVSESPGRLRLRSELLYQREHLSPLERCLKDTVGIIQCKTNPITGSVLIIYDENKLTKTHIIVELEKILQITPIGMITKENLSINRMTTTTAVLLLTIMVSRLLPRFKNNTTPIIMLTWLKKLKKATDHILKKELTVDFLDSIIILLCLTSKNIVAAAFMIWVLEVANSLLDLTTQQSKKALTDILGKQPRFVSVFCDGREVETPLEMVDVGDIIVGETGEEIPLDGIIWKGEGLLDQHLLIGESTPVLKKSGDRVYASTLILAGRLFIKVTETMENTVKAKILKIIEETSQYKPKMLTLGENFANRMIIPTLSLGVIGFIVKGSQSAMAIINSDFGTGIRVAAPIALFSSLTIALHNNIIIKNGKCLEALSDVDVFLFDKTGTLTEETPEITEIISLNNGYSEEKILGYAASIEQNFTHPIARAILKKAKERKVKSSKTRLSEYQVGLGIRAVVNGDSVKIGSLRFIESEGISIPDLVKQKKENCNTHGGSLILLAVDDCLVGAFRLGPKIRDEIKQIFDQLKRKGKEIIIVSGDDRGPTQVLAEHLGVETYFSGLLPQEKAEIVKRLQNKGQKVAMVGDGVNDALALSLADISISLRGASDVAIDTADVVFLDGSLDKFELLYEISDDFHTSIKNIFHYMIVLPNTISIMGALLGIVDLRSSMILNNLFSCLAAFSAILPLVPAAVVPTTLTQRMYVHDLE